MAVSPHYAAAAGNGALLLVRWNRGKLGRDACYRGDYIHFQPVLIAGNRHHSPAPTDPNLENGFVLPTHNHQLYHLELLYLRDRGSFNLKMQERRALPACDAKSPGIRTVLVWRVAGEPQSMEV